MVTVSAVREVRLTWFEHVLKRDSRYTWQRMMRMKLSGRRKKGRPQKRFMQRVRFWQQGEMEVIRGSDP